MSDDHEQELSSQSTEDNQTLEEWWKEDAQRLNKLAELARPYAVGTEPGPPPALNPDGSLKDKGTEDSPSHRSEDQP